MAETTIFISAGDASGDLHAANFMAEMEKKFDSCEFVGFGMERMRKAGLRPLGEEDDADGAMWLHNLLRLGDFWRKLRRCRELFDENPPQLVVLVDFGGFNLYVAREASRRRIPVVYYIPPQVWAHGKYRLKKIKKWVDRAIVIYPFEPQLYEEYGIDVKYVGHPLFDEVSRTDTAEEARWLQNRCGENLIALFPGSRTQEVKANLPLILKAAGRLEQRFDDLSLACVLPDQLKGPARKIIRDARPEVKMPDISPAALARAARLCLTKSGTITLEIAAMGTPMVILYRLHPFIYFLGLGVQETPYVGLINNLAGEMICPERVMPWADADWLEREALRFLENERDYERCTARMRQVLAGYACPGASKKAAEMAAEMCQS
ncbi:MAG: lipid-A-disaccharide synthase [Planctomycetota bacterium]